MKGQIIAIIVSAAAVLFASVPALAVFFPKMRANWKWRGTQEPVGRLSCAGFALSGLSFGAGALAHEFLPAIYGIVCWLGLMSGFVLAVVGGCRDGRAFRAAKGNQ